MNSKKKEKLWTFQFVLITTINLTIFFGFQLLTPILPVYVKSLGISDNTIGWVTGIFTIAALLVRPFTGSALDRLGRRIIFLFGLIVFIVATASYSWLPTVGLILAVRFVHGLGWGIASTATNTIASDVIPGQRFGEGMGYFTLAANVAMAIFPGIGLYIIANYSFKAASLLATSLVLVALFLSFALKYKPVTTEKKAQKQLELFEMTSVRPSVIMFFTTVTYGAINSFLALYAQERGFTKAGTFFTVMAIAMVISRPLFGMLVDRFGFSLAVIPGLLIIMISMLLLGKATTLPLFLISGAAYGIGFGATQTSLQAMAVTSAPRDRMGLANSTFVIGFDTGIGFGSIILGQVAAISSYGDMFLWSAASVAIALVLYLTIGRRQLSSH